VVASPGGLLTPLSVSQGPPAAPETEWQSTKLCKEAEHQIVKKKAHLISQEIIQLLFIIIIYKDGGNQKAVNRYKERIWQFS
jgi:hypothetical protein